MKFAEKRIIYLSILIFYGVRHRSALCNIWVLFANLYKFKYFRSIAVGRGGVVVRKERLNQTGRITMDWPAVGGAVAYDIDRTFLCCYVMIVL